jgi:hypothetical protein
VRVQRRGNSTRETSCLRYSKGDIVSGGGRSLSRRSKRAWSAPLEGEIPKGARSAASSQDMRNVPWHSVAIGDAPGGWLACVMLGWGR